MKLPFLIYLPYLFLITVSNFITVFGVKENEVGLLLLSHSRPLIRLFLSKWFLSLGSSYSQDLCRIPSDGWLYSSTLWIPFTLKLTNLLLSLPVSCQRRDFTLQFSSYVKIGDEKKRI